MHRQAIYGLPLNPAHLLEQLAGSSFCVSYATRDRLGRQLEQAIELVGESGILLVDNGAFSLHKKGISARDESYLEAYEAWAAEILERCPQAIAVIPDVIDGSEEENAQLVRETLLERDRAMPIWHMHESLDYLLYLCEGHEYVGIGSSGQYWQCGTPAWHARITEAFAAIDAWEQSSNGAYIRPRLHMMRAQSQAHLFPFDSSDSTNVAMNHGRYRAEGEGHVARFAERAAARIQAVCGPEAEHQLKRPLLGHLETAVAQARIAALVAESALFVVNHSGGKDSQAMLIRMLELVPHDQILVVHAALGEVEWDGALELAQQQAADAELPFVVARARKTFLEMVERRFATRPEVPSFPSSAHRQCTSDLKRDPIVREARAYAKEHGFATVVDCTGVRAQESAARSKLEVFKVNKRNSTAGRSWFDWAPIHELTTAQVFATIREAGQEPHPAYAAGNERLSCVFCIMGSRNDLRRGAQARPELFRRYVELEQRTGYTMHMSRKPLAELCA